MARPKKPERLKLVKVFSARLTSVENEVLDKIKKARRADGLAGHENDGAWLRVMLYEQALALGIKLPDDFALAWNTRILNDGRYLILRADHVGIKAHVVARQPS